MESKMPIKVCKYCGESFELRPGKPGYANECEEFLHEKTPPQPLGVDESKVDGVIADFISRAGTQK